MAEGNIAPPKYDFKGHRDPDNVIDVDTSDEEIDDNTVQRRVQEQNEIPPQQVAVQPIALPQEDQVQALIDTHLPKMDQIVEQMQQVTISPMTYLQHTDQIAKIQSLEVGESKLRAEYDEKLKKLLDLILANDNDQLKEFAKTLDDQAKEQKAITTAKETQLTAAQSIAGKYKKSLPLPKTLNKPDNLPPQRLLPREILSAAGRFNPSEDRANFNQMWSKLCAFGESNYYDEDEYKTALQYVLDGDAYDTFRQMMEDDRDLKYIINHFAQIYGKKRSAARDNFDLDTFVRRKNEPIDTCMHRALIPIDRLQHTYPKEHWPEQRKTIQRIILSQVISPDTVRHIRLEEEDALEKTGVRIEIDKLIELAKKYETFHNRIPSKEVVVPFQAASGGLLYNVEHLQNENKELKKQKYDRENKVEKIYEILATTARPFKNEGRSRDRESRSRERFSSQKDARRSSFDKNRNLTPEPPPTPTMVTYKKRDVPPPRPPSLDRRRDKRQRSQSGERTSRAPTPFRSYSNTSFGNPASNRPQSYRSPFRDQNYQRGRYPYDRDRRRSRSQSRDRGYDRQSRDRSRDRQRRYTPDNRRYRYPSPSPQRRPRSSERPTERYSRSDSRKRERYDYDSQQGNPSFDKSVILNINGANSAENLKN